MDEGVWTVAEAYEDVMEMSWFSQEKIISGEIRLDPEKLGQILKIHLRSDSDNHHLNSLHSLNFHSTQTTI